MKARLPLILIPLLLAGCATQIRPNLSATPTPPTAVVSSSFGNISWVMAASWQEVRSKIWTAPVGPLLFLSNARIIDPCASSFRGADCWKPLTQLPSGGILVTFAGSATAQLPKPSPVLVEIAADSICKEIGGEREIVTFFLGVGINACLRGPDFTANETLFRQMMFSMKKS